MVPRSGNVSPPHSPLSPLAPKDSQNKFSPPKSEGSPADGQKKLPPPARRPSWSIKPTLNDGKKAKILTENPDPSLKPPISVGSPSYYPKEFPGGNKYLVERPYAHFEKDPDPIVEMQNHWYGQHKAVYQPLVDQIHQELQELKKTAPVKSQGIENIPHEGVPLLQKKKCDYKDEGLGEKIGNHMYWWRIPKDKERKEWVRCPVGEGSALNTVVLVDENIEAAGKETYKLHTIEISPDGKLAAVVSNSDDAEYDECSIRNLETGKQIDNFPVTSRNMVWSLDSKEIFYNRKVKDEGNSNDNKEKKVTYSYELYRRRVDTPSPIETSLYKQSAKGCSHMGCSLVGDTNQLLIDAGDWKSNEVKILDLNNPDAEPKLIRKRQDKIKYKVQFERSKFWIRTNDTHRNFRLAVASIDNPGKWEDFLPGDDNVDIRGVSAYPSHLLLTTCNNGRDEFVVVDYDKGPNNKIKSHVIQFPDQEKGYTAFLGQNGAIGSQAAVLAGSLDNGHAYLRYSSELTPEKIYELNVATKEVALKKAAPLPLGFDPKQYATDRLFVPFNDGEKEYRIPADFCYHREFYKPDGKHPLFILLYCEYGITMKPDFERAAIVAMNHGYGFLRLHASGSGAQGQIGRERGEGKNRHRTFNEIQVGLQYCVDNHYMREGGAVLFGASAGGTSVAYTVVKTPEHVGAALLDSGFVNVLESMSDDTQKLTQGEIGMRGDPKKEEDFQYLFEIDPDKQMKQQNMPPVFHRVGRLDKFVLYKEGHEWAAKAQAMNTNANPILIKTTPEGHDIRTGNNMDMVWAERLAFAFHYNGEFDQPGAAIPCEKVDKTPVKPELVEG